MERVIGRSERERAPAAAIALGFLHLLWVVVRFPIVSLMVLLLPIATVVLTFAAVTALLIAVVFEASSAGPYFSFWTMIGVSVACLALSALLHVLAGLLVR